MDFGVCKKGLGKIRKKQPISFTPVRLTNTHLRGVRLPFHHVKFYARALTHTKKNKNKKKEKEKKKKEKKRRSNMFQSTWLIVYFFKFERGRPSQKGKNSSRNHSLQQKKPPLFQKKKKKKSVLLC